MTHHRPVAPPVDYDTRPALNDNGPIPPGAAMASAYGGAAGIIIMVAVAVALGIWFAIGHS